MKKRSVRRHHSARMKKKAIKIMKTKWFVSKNYDYKMEGIKIHNHIKNCSCNMCCNPRNSDWLNDKYKKTFQEIRSNMNFKEYMEEI